MSKFLIISDANNSGSTFPSTFDVGRCCDQDVITNIGHDETFCSSSSS